ncbi:hypothetical protein ACU61A_05390 [Pseudonocardia sichuanensis]
MSAPSASNSATVFVIVVKLTPMAEDNSFRPRGPSRTILRMIADAVELR